MFRKDDNTKMIEMDLGDYGVSLFFRITNSESLSAKIKIYTESETLIDKELIKDEDGRFEFKLTPTETNRLGSGNYFWSLTIFNGETNSVLVKNKLFKVVKE